MDVDARFLDGGGEFTRRKDGEALRGARPGAERRDKAKGGLVLEVVRGGGCYGAAMGRLNTEIETWAAVKFEMTSGMGEGAETETSGLKTNKRSSPRLLRAASAGFSAVGGMSDVAATRAGSSMKGRRTTASQGARVPSASMARESGKKARRVGSEGEGGLK
jgi:hypothetical protein